MTVLEAEEDTDERSAPPRKKPRLPNKYSHDIRKFIQVSKRYPCDDYFDNSVNSYLDSVAFNGETMNGYTRSNFNNHQDSNNDLAGLNADGLRVATLSNLGNTCFLNSVLYTLRFAPSFLHNLHHLATDLSTVNEKQIQTKIKSSSLGRNDPSLTTSGSRSWSSKDLLALAGSNGEFNKPRIQVATEKMHELFMALRESETRDSTEPYQPDAFLQALREVNPIFEGNQQQDAHELLVCLLDNIRETFQLLVKQRERQCSQTNGTTSDLTIDNPVDPQLENNSGKRNLRKSWKKKKATNAGKLGSSSASQAKVNGVSAKPLENGHSENASESNSNSLTCGQNVESKKCFISEDFEGVSLLRTTCLECEHITERKETFCDICVPIEMDRTTEKGEDGKLGDSEVYKRAVVTSEFLGGRDKYWCAQCLRYNEARRAVCFPSLPRLLILQLKRFSTAAGSMEKINNYMPTPLKLQCFCEECNERENGDRAARHEYKLYSVIMHQGATITAGHYVAYTRLPESPTISDYINCDHKTKRHNNSEQSSTNATTSDKSTSSFLSLSLGRYFREVKSKSLTNNENKQQLSRASCHSAECCGIRQNKHTGTWLECDDEAVRVIPIDELEDKLAPNSRNSATPYLLFYVRSMT